MEHNHLEDTIHIRIGTELREQLARLATAEERTVSAWARKVLREAAQRAGSEQAA
jgi:hypothetical protein